MRKTNLNLKNADELKNAFNNLTNVEEVYWTITNSTIFFN